MGSTKLLKMKSSDRAYVISVIRLFKNCNLIKEDNNNWSIGDEKEDKTNFVGLEVVDIIDGMNKYRT